MLDPFVENTLRDRPIMLLMKIVVALTSSDSQISDTVKSVLDGQIQPSEILVTLRNGIKVPQSLRKNDKVHIHRIEESAPDYGMLNALVGVMDRYPSHSDIYILLLDSTCTYPPHLITEYGCIKELEQKLKERVPTSNGSIYGLGGVVMAHDKRRNMDLEFQELLGKSTESYEKRNMLGYVLENATVDYLEICGSILIHRQQLKDDFLVYLSKLFKAGEQLQDTPKLCNDIVLSNYFAKHQIHRTQICNLAINRFMLKRAGYFKNYQELDEPQKRDFYERTVKYLRAQSCFYVYE